MNKKKKAAVAATALALAMAVTGTLAWQNMPQVALNEAQQVVKNPGARLHDDFDGQNKDVYVENFTTTAEGKAIYARVRLDEYMEIGTDAGDKTNADRDAKSIVSGADINDVSTWTTHIPGETTFDTYWDWTTGGSTVYMPTFNMNKDSIVADINGTYEGTVAGDDTHYNDYVTYTAGQTKTADEVYDNDTNDVDEGDAATTDNIRTVANVEHTAKSTLDGTVMTMQEWIDGGKVAGNYWVWDTDGWAYWANPIQPGEATGLLLSGIELDDEMLQSWYYGINVVGQFITADDLGKDNNAGFYADEDEAPTAEALELLKTIGVEAAPVDNALVAQIKAATPNDPNSKVTIPGVGECYVISVDGDNATLLPVDCIGNSVFGSNSEYEGSTIQGYVQNWLANTAQPADGRITGARLMTYDEADNLDPSIRANGSYWWLFTPSGGYSVYCVNLSGNISGHGCLGDLGFRPVLTYNLAD